MRGGWRLDGDRPRLRLDRDGQILFVVGAAPEEERGGERGGGELVEFMTRGPVVVSVLEGEGAITKYRELMGATNPANADEGTIRKEFAKDVGENAVHGSDAPETAANEIRYFFPGYEV